MRVLPPPSWSDERIGLSATTEEFVWEHWVMNPKSV
jgi:hypothetical protein